MFLGKLLVVICRTGVMPAKPNVAKILDMEKLPEPRDGTTSLEAGPPPPGVGAETLDYAPRKVGKKRSFIDILAIIMAIVTMAWLYYVEYYGGSTNGGGPLWEALNENAFWPGGITLALSVIGVVRNDRSVLCVAAIAIILWAYVLAGFRL
jgi:hypothetical protein